MNTVHLAGHKKPFRVPLAAIVLLAGLLGSGAGREIAAGTGYKAVAKNVLVFSNKGRFDDPVVSWVIYGLNNEGLTVTLRSGKTLKGASAKKYGAVIIFNFVEKNRAERGVKVFADENLQKKIILFNAVGDDYLAPAAGTSETKETRAEKLAEEIIGKTKAVLSR